LSGLNEFTVCCSSPFPLTHNPLLGFPILLLSLGDHIIRQPDVLHVLLPLTDQPVPHVLLIKRILSSSGSVGVRSPVSRRVGREDLVDQDESRSERLGFRGGWEEAEFEFGVGEDDSSGFSVGSSLGYGVDAE